MKAVVATLALLLLTVNVEAQRRGGGPPGGPGGPGRGARVVTGTVERITVHGKALEGNAEIDSADRAVAVYLPPSYAGDQNRRFPVVYLLHGIGWNETGFLDGPPRLQQSADRLAGAQGFSEFIVVTPSVATAGKSGVYSAAWERFVADDLVAHVDGKYRTLAHRMSRGIAGHETGANTALRIGMARPDVFANLYAMSVSDPASVTRDLEKGASNLNAYYGIALDVGAADPALESNRALHAAMTKLRIAHTFEEYDGDRASRLRERVEQHVLPFFARNLASPANLTSPSPGADRLAPPAR